MSSGHGAGGPVWLISEGVRGALGWDYEPVGVAFDPEVAKDWATAQRGLPYRPNGWHEEPGFAPTEHSRLVLDCGDDTCLVVAEWLPLGC